jgi:hypothetical protein
MGFYRFAPATLGCHSPEQGARLPKRLSVTLPLPVSFSKSAHENGERMSKHEVMWTTAGAAGVVSALLAGLTVWVVLTNPMAVADAAGRADTLGRLHAVASAVCGAAAHVLRYL